MSMCEPEVDSFFQSFNQIIADEYGFHEINEYIRKEGVVQSNTGLDKNEKLKNVQIGDMLNPCFGINGEFVGFQVRAELAKSMMFDSAFDLTHLKRIIKICIFTN